MNPDRPQPSPAGPELLLLARWEESAAWIFSQTARWPKVLRFSLTAQIERLTLEILENLIVARFSRQARPQKLSEVNLALEKIRFFSRLARSRSALSPKSFESLQRRLNEAGKMLHGWRQTAARQEEPK